MSPQLVISLLIALVASVFIYVVPIRLWIAAKTAGAGETVTFMMLISLRLRRVPPEVVVNPIMVATVVGIPVDPKRIEDLWRARGDVDQVMAAYVASHKFGMNHGFDDLASINLAGRNAIDHVKKEAESRGLFDLASKQTGCVGQQQNKR